MALAIGWAVYLLPKALRHHDEEDRRRSVEEFSDSVRIVGRGVVQTVRAHATRAPEAETVKAPAPPAPRTSTITREAARNAARRRRRVLALLISTLAVVSVTSFLSYTPSYTVAIPLVLIVAFLVTARLTVRAQQAVRRSAPVQQIDDEREEQADQHLVQPRPVAEVEADLDGEDTQGLSRDELAEVVGEPVLDEGGLWDPLPVTLPTYVNKARARRTVRTIELTASTTGITSSGHDASDSELAREAELQAELQAEVEAEVDVIGEAKAAGA